MNIISNNLNGTSIIIKGNIVYINGKEISPCPGKGQNLTTINNRIYLSGYEYKNGKWKRTLKAIWYKWF